MDLIQEITSSAPGVSSTAFLTLCVTSFFTSVISAAFGLGGGTMLFVIMASLLPPLAIIPTHAIIQMNSNLTRALFLWRHIKFTWMMPFIIGTVLGAAVGGQVVYAIPKHTLQGIIGIFVIYSLWGPKIGSIKLSNLSFVGIGGIASFATMFVGGTGPLIAPFIKASTNERRTTVATHAAFMSWQHGIKIIAFGILGFAFAPYMALLVGMIILGIIGTWSGKILLNWMPEKVFRKAFNITLGLLAINLIIQAVIHGVS